MDSLWALLKWFKVEFSGLSTHNLGNSDITNVVEVVWNNFITMTTRTAVHFTPKWALGGYSHSLGSRNEFVSVIPVSQ